MTRLPFLHNAALSKKKKEDPLTKERICSLGANSSPQELTPNENEGKNGNKGVVSPKMTIQLKCRQFHHIQVFVCG